MADESKSVSAVRRGHGRKATGRRRKTPSKRHRALVLTAWITASVVLLGGSALGYAYYKLNGNLTGVDINAALGTDRPDDVDNDSMDILVLGSDSRAGKNGKYGRDEGGARSDTAMIVHVYEGRKKASVVSIPRDTLIQRPTCTKNDKEAPAAKNAMFNTAYEVGGPACAVKTVESMSGIRMDHYLEVDFSGFQNLIDVLGGVDITTTEPIHDKDSHLDLEPGEHTLTGEQSLGLVRTRHGVGDGSDLGRIKLQQAFIKALIDQVKQVGVFGNPKRLYDLADTSTGALTTDSDLASVDKLLGFARGLKGIDSKNMEMVTLPVQYDPNDRNRVLPLREKAGQVWQALLADQPIPKSATKGSAGDATDAGKVVGDDTSPTGGPEKSAEPRTEASTTPPRAGGGTER
ncbi:LCP family protein [Streptomyces zagrosensis]|uniref:LCP family protein required for cell wall assembly n=1 Tax=Streptomyces zagrosensis TaxID=1042984 RepID=A0A7W9UZG3_9ACTN|nr:LCP family protein [Streptomyces zagrosensis]MBB5935744.1 LCP family protein required for cell wall assembly [Streptomyces zagrosensis]